MMRLPLFKKERETFLALDIGTETIKALIFKREEGKNVILGADLKEYYRLGIQDGRDIDKEIMEKAILEVITQAGKKAKIETRNCVIFCRLPGSILKERIISHSFKRENSKDIIDKKEEKKIYQEIQRKTQEEISQEIFRESGILPQDIHFLDFRILERKIGGYEVDKLSGISGQNLSFRILLTSLPRNYLENINKIVRNLKLNNLRLVSEAENLLSSFSDRKITAIFLDIGGRSTQITIMRRGKIQASSSFGAGGEIFSQKLSQVLGIDKAQAEDLKIKYTRRDLSEEARKRTREMIFYSSQLWFNGLKLKLREISNKNKGILPPTIYLFGGGSLMPEIEEILSGENWDDLPLLRLPEIKFIILKDLKNIEDRANIINTPQYTPSLLLCYTNA